MLRKNVKFGKLMLGLMLAIFVIGTGPGMTPVVKAADAPADIQDTYTYNRSMAALRTAPKPLKTKG